MSEKIVVDQKSDISTRSSSIADSQNELPLTLEDIDPKIEASLRRKFDLRILSSCTLLYLFAFLTRANIGNAKVLGMQDELQFEGNQMSTCLTGFFITYILCEIPANILCKKLGPRIALPGISFAFGIITMCIGFTNSFGGVFAARFILGAAQAGIMPGISYTLGTFYRRHELVTRVGIYASCASLAGAFGGLLAIGFSNIPAWGMMHTWRNIFFFEGILTMVVAIIAYFMMAQSPGTASFLTEEERRIGHLRIQLEVMTKKDVKVNASHFKMGILNLNTVFITIALFASLIVLNSISLFMPSLLSSMGWDNLLTQVMTVPPYAVGCVLCITVSILSDKFKTRGIFVYTLAAPLIVIGFAVLLGVKDANGPRYMAIFFGTAGAFTAVPLLVGWVVENTAGPAVRALASAFTISAGSIGGLIATWIYLADTAPDYIPGHSVNLACGILLCIASGAASMRMKWENIQREDGKRDHILEGLTPDEVGELGHNHPKFRFTP